MSEKKSASFSYRFLLILNSIFPGLIITASQKIGAPRQQLKHDTVDLSSDLSPYDNHDDENVVNR
jgi:hypothetical protein